ncbi:MAG: retropepsin-like aspartic protease [Pseudomonadota bacterium]
MKPRLWLRLFVLVCLLAFSGNPASASNDRSLQLHDTLTGRPVTTVIVNETESLALIDTAATIALIESDLLAFSPEDEVQDEQARILGLGGRRDYPIANLSRLRAGSEDWTNLRVAVNAEKEFPVRTSVLPISIFDARVIDFDFLQGRLHLYDTRPKRVRRGAGSALKYQDINGLLFLPIQINGAKGLALIDTGADLSFVNPAFADRARAKRDDHKTKIMRGSDLASNRASIYDFKRLRLGRHSVDRLTLLVVATDLFADLGFEETPMMVIGMDLLSNFRMQIDRQTQRVTLVHVPTRSRKE